MTVSATVSTEPEAVRGSGPAMPAWTVRPATAAFYERNGFMALGPRMRRLLS